MIGQTIGYRYDVNLLPDYTRLTPFLKKYIEAMGWDDLKSSTRYEFDCDERKICTLLSDVSELQSQVGDIEGQIEEIEDKNNA